MYGIKKLIINSINKNLGQNGLAYSLASVKSHYFDIFIDTPNDGHFCIECKDIKVKNGTIYFSSYMVLDKVFKNNQLLKITGRTGLLALSITSNDKREFLITSYSNVLKISKLLSISNDEIIKSDFFRCLKKIDEYPFIDITLDDLDI